MAYAAVYMNGILAFAVRKCALFVGSEQRSCVHYADATTLWGRMCTAAFSIIGASGNVLVS